MPSQYSQSLDLDLIAAAIIPANISQALNSSEDAEDEALTPRSSKKPISADGIPRT